MLVGRSVDESLSDEARISQSLHTPAAFAEASRAIYAETARLGGTVAGEHGVGLTSRDHLELCRDAAYLSTLRAVKDALDPRGILNPGKVLPLSSR